MSKSSIYFFIIILIIVIFIIFSFINRRGRLDSNVESVIEIDSETLEQKEWEYDDIITVDPITGKKVNIETGEIVEE